jgi:HK97 family phage major capsid protein
LIVCLIIVKFKFRKNIMKYSEMLAKLKADNARIIEIDEMAEVTEELKAEQDVLITACEDMKGKIERKKASIETEGYLADATENKPIEARVIGASPIIQETITAAKPIVIPARAARFNNTLRAFKGKNADIDAFTSGMWLSAVLGNASAAQFCNEHGIAINAVHEEGVNTTGGYLVPTVLHTAIIDLQKEYGVFRRESEVIPMTSDKLLIPRTTGGLEAYFVGESAAMTESTASWDDITLSVKDCGVLTRVTNALASDAIIQLMDNLTVKIARALALKEDLVGFLGTGISTHGGITGVITKLISTAWTAPSVNTGAGLVEWGTGVGFENITLANLTSLMALLPTYARAGAKWHCTPAFFDSVITRLVLAQGGSTATEVINGIPMTRALGYPVVLNETMNSVGTDQEVSLLFGDLGQATTFGDRQQMSIASSDSATIGGQSMFERNQRALRAIERFDIVAHDVGTSSAPGPIVGLMAYDAS